MFDGWYHLKETDVLIADDYVIKGVKKYGNEYLEVRPFRFDSESMLLVPGFPTVEDYFKKYYVMLRPSFAYNLNKHINGNWVSIVNNMIEGDLYED